MFVRLFLSVALLPLVLFGFAQTKTIVKPNDAVSVVCEEEPSLSKHYAITRDGYIVMQFVGAIAIAGLDEKSAAAKIAATLIEQRIVGRATVTLKVLGATQGGLITFSGAVNKAGEVFPRKGIRLSDVVADAKPTSAADLEHVRIVSADGKEIVIDFSKYDGKNNAFNPELRAGDRVIFELVARSQDLSVTGMVKRPGIVPFTKGMSLAKAIELAGGLTADADPAGIRIQRAGAALSQSTMTMELRVGDHVFVPQSAAVGTIKVSGAVSNPIPVPFRQGMGAAQAIDAAGGLKPGADPGRVKVLREIDGKKQQLFFDYGAVKRGMSADMPLRAKDEVEVFMTRRRSAFGLKQIAPIAILGVIFGVLKF